MLKEFPKNKGEKRALTNEDNQNNKKQKTADETDRQSIPGFALCNRIVFDDESARSSKGSAPLASFESLLGENHFVDKKP